MATLITKICQFVAIIAVFISFANADICISGTTKSNSMFFGNYVQSLTMDINGNIYYTKQQTYKEQQDCTNDNQQEYLYIRNGYWQASYTLNGASSYLRCSQSPTPTDLICPPGAWNNGGNIDTSITSTNNACPPEIPSPNPILSCTNAIKIESTNSLCSGVFNKIQDGLYRKNGDCEAYFYYNSYQQIWECGSNDERNYCNAFIQPNQYYLRSNDIQIESILDGNAITVDLEYPLAATATITCAVPVVTTPTISCDVIELKNTGNCDVNGIYTKVGNKSNLYQKGDKYFQYSELSQNFLIANADVSSGCSTGLSYIYYLKSTDTVIGELIEGFTDVPIKVTYPINSNIVTISCLAMNAAASIPLAPKVGDICVSIPKWLNDCPNDWKVSGLYVPIANVNGYPTYQLDQSCGAIRYLFYVKYYNRYIISDSLNDPPKELYFYCTNTDTDLSKCLWSDPSLIQVQNVLTKVGGCGCDSFV